MPTIDRASWAVGILNSYSVKNIMKKISEKELIPGKILLSYLLDFLKRDLQNKNVCLFSFVSILADCLLSALFVHQLKNGSAVCKKCQQGSEKMSNRIEKSAYVNLVWSDPQSCRVPDENAQPIDGH